MSFDDLDENLRLKVLSILGKGGVYPYSLVSRKTARDVRNESLWRDIAGISKEEAEKKRKHVVRDVVKVEKDILVNLSYLGEATMFPIAIYRINRFSDREKVRRALREDLLVLGRRVTDYWRDLDGIADGEEGDDFSNSYVNLTEEILEDMFRLVRSTDLDDMVINYNNLTPNNNVISISRSPLRNFSI